MDSQNEVTGWTRWEKGRGRVLWSDEGGKPSKEPPGWGLCTSLEQASAFLHVQCLVTWEVPHQSLKTFALSDMGGPLGFINLVTSQDLSLINTFLPPSTHTASPWCQLLKSPMFQTPGKQDNTTQLETRKVQKQSCGISFVSPSQHLYTKHHPSKPWTSQPCTCPCLPSELQDATLPRPFPRPCIYCTTKACSPEHTLGLPGCQLPGLTTNTHFFISPHILPAAEPGHYRISQDSNDSASCWMGEQVRGVHLVCTWKHLAKQQPMHKPATLYWKLDRNWPKKEKEILLYFTMHHTKLWPQTSHLISIIGKSWKSDHVVQIHSLKGKGLDICLHVFSCDYALPRCGNKWCCKSSSIELSVI